jgi:hypothetical protein
MKGFKGFDKDLKCRGMQYSIGETAKHSGTINLCNSGLHFCEHPLDTWSYYKPLDGSRYAEVEADGVSDRTEKDSKRVAQSLTVKAEVKIPALLKAAVEFVFQKVKPTTGYYAHSATTGDSAHSATTGYSAHSATTGDSAHSATTGDSAHSSTKGKHAIAAALGYKGAAQGALGGWLVLSEIGDDLSVKAIGVARVDGKKIKADTLYSLRGGKFVEVEK